MTMQKGLIQRNISVPQSVINDSRLGPLVQGMQQALALSAEQGLAWYEVGYQLIWGHPPKQLILAHAIVTQASDDHFMSILSHTVDAYNIQGVQSWSSTIDSLGYPMQLGTQAASAFTVADSVPG